MSSTRLHEAMLRPRDPGLQGERTALAWQRTSLAVFANGLLALRSASVARSASLTALAVALLIAAGAAFCYGAWRRRHLLSSHSAIAPRAIAMALTALVTLVACATGVASILLT